MADATPGAAAGLDEAFDDVADARRRCEAFREVFLALRNEIGRVLVGQNEVVDLTLAALFADGHVLLEGVPGLGKTLLVRTIGECLRLDFSRIQFTPALRSALSTAGSGALSRIGSSSTGGGATNSASGRGAGLGTLSPLRGTATMASAVNALAPTSAPHASCSLRELIAPPPCATRPRSSRPRQERTWEARAA